MSQVATPSRKLATITVKATARLKDATTPLTAIATSEICWKVLREQEVWKPAGIDPADTKAVRRFDRKREGRSTSNTEWVNPHDYKPGSANTASLEKRTRVTAM